MSGLEQIVYLHAWDLTTEGFPTVTLDQIRRRVMPIFGGDPGIARAARGLADAGYLERTDWGVYRPVSMPVGEEAA